MIRKVIHVYIHVQVIYMYTKDGQLESRILHFTFFKASITFRKHFLILLAVKKVEI